MRRWQVQGLDLTGREDAARGSTRAARCSWAAPSPRPRPTGSARAVPCCSPRCPTCRSTPGGRTSTPPRELYDGLERGYEHTPDARIYAWSRKAAHRRSAQGPARAVAARQLDRRRARGVHPPAPHRRRHGRPRADPRRPGLRRGGPLAHDLAAAGLTVATGGGPGAMEAANLGARLADAARERPRRGAGPDRRGAVVPARRDRLGARRHRQRARPRATPGARSGIPTWHYGHEPPNAFSSVSRSTSATPSARTCCSRSAAAGSSSCPARPGRCRRSSRRRARTTTPTEPEVAPMVFVGPRLLDRDAARVAAGRGPRRGPAVRRPALTSSTTRSRSCLCSCSDRLRRRSSSSAGGAATTAPACGSPCTDVRRSRRSRTCSSPSSSSARHRSTSTRPGPRHRGQPRGDVHHRAEHVAEPGQRRSPGQADPDLGEVLVAVGLLDQLQADPRDRLGVVGHEQQLVADGLDDPAVVGGDDLQRPLLEVVDHPADLAPGQRPALPGVVDDVGEPDAHHGAGLALDLVVAVVVRSAVGGEQQPRRGARACAAARRSSAATRRPG